MCKHEHGDLYTFYITPADVSLDSKVVRLAPNGINVGLFKISFSTFWLTEPKCTETDLKKSQICPIWDNLTKFRAKPDIHVTDRYNDMKVIVDDDGYFKQQYPEDMHSPTPFPMFICVICCLLITISVND